MTYSLTTGTDYFAHLQTISAIERSGSRVETAIHSGLMSLATAQAKAMKELGTRIDDRLVQIDETINTGFSEIKFCLDGISDQIGRGFTAMDERLADIDKTLARLAKDTANPEETRARERFRRALELYKAGHYAPALEQVDHAIANNGGPSFGHVSEFQALKGMLHMGNPKNLDATVINPAKAHTAFLAAGKYAATTSSKDRRDRADHYYQAGLAAYAAGDPAAAIEAYRLAIADYDALRSDHYGRNPSSAHFQIARSALILGDIATARTHLVRAIDLNWKMLAAVAADPDCITHQDIVEPIVSDYVKTTLPEARHNLEALCYILIAGGPRNVSTMHKKIHQATLPEGMEADTRHMALENFRSLRHWHPDLEKHYWGCFGVYSPYPTGLTDDQARALHALLRDETGLVDIAIAMEQLDADQVLTEALQRTGRYWDLIDRPLKYGQTQLEEGKLPRGMLPGSTLPTIPEPRLSTEGGFLARRRAQKHYEEAVKERERIHDEARVVISRDYAKIVAQTRRELPGVLSGCRKMIARSQDIQKEADAAFDLLHPNHRWKKRGQS